MSTKLKLIKLGNKELYLIKGTTQVELAKTFVRLAEFYESPFNEIKNKYFTLDTFKEKYAKEYGAFTYYKDWSGYNIPGNIVRKFFTMFKGYLNRREKELEAIIKDILDSGLDFYLIGTYESTALDHEMSHGLYYLDKEYKREMDELTAFCSYKHLVYERLLTEGYCKEVLKDEIAAYLATSSAKRLERDFYLNENNIEVVKYKEVFAKYKGKLYE